MTSELLASPLLEALNLIQDSKHQLAADVLETSFLSQPNKSLSIDEALLILTLEGIQLKQPRHYYAAYVLDNAKVLNSQQKTNFLQIAIDGYFSKGAFERAQHYATLGKGLADIKPDAKNNMQYQFAWILVNQHQYSKAIIELRSLLKSTQNSIFRDKIVQDLGLFEGELFGKNRKYSVQIYPKLKIMRILTL